MTAIQPSIHCIPPAAPGRPSRRRRSLPTLPGQAGLGAVQLAPATQLPLTAHVGISVRGRILYPILGAVVGALLLGLPGTLIGAGIGMLLA